MYFYLLSPARRRLFHQQIAQELEESLEDTTVIFFIKEIAYQLSNPKIFCVPYLLSWPI